MQEINLSGAMGLFQPTGGVATVAVNNKPSNNSFQTELNQKMTSYQERDARPAERQNDRRPAEKVGNEANQTGSRERAEKVVDENGAEQKVANAEKLKDNSQTEGDAPQAEAVVVKVSDLIEKLNLNDDQVAELAYQLGVTVSELQDMTIEVNTDALINTPLTLKGKNQFNPEFQNKLGNSSVIKGILQDGTEIDIAAMLNLDKEGEKANLNRLVDKIATALGLDTKEVETMTEELGIQKIAIETKTPEKSDTTIVKDFISQKGIKTQTDKSAENNQNQSDSKSGEEKSASPFLTKKAGSSEVQKEDINKAMKIEVNKSSITDGNEKDLKAVTEVKQVETSNKVVTEIITQKVDGKEVKVTQVTEVKHGNSETSRKIMSQIIEKVQILSLPNKTEAKITLTPAQLGSIDIKIIVQDAQVRGHIVVDNQNVKQIVEQNINQLKDAIANQGINLSEVTVDVNENRTQFEGQNNNGNEGSGGTAQAFGANDGFVEDEQRQASIAREQFRRSVNNSVVYMTA